MIQTLYTGATGLTSQQKNIDVIAHNVSNLQTEGFKRSRFDFRDCLYMRMQSPVDNSPGKNLQRGAGAIEYQIARMFAQGATLTTERTLDFMLDGRGFFAVENPNQLEDNEGRDAILYTRKGNFYVTPEEEGGFLVDADGRYLLEEGGERISLRYPSTLSISAEGVISETDNDGNSFEVATLALKDFSNRDGLQSVGDNYFMESANSGELIAAGGTVRQGALEGSNVDYGNEVTRLIRAQRAYQLASRVISTADQMMQTANNIRQ